MNAESRELKQALSSDRFPAIVRPYVARVNTDVASHDAMFDFTNGGNREHYFSCGASALSCLLHATGLSRLGEPGRLLDFGCGAGRVTRWLRAAFPGAQIHGCDVRAQDLEFVRKRFAATTWVSGTDVDALSAPASYDVIWVGSVFTHLSAQSSVLLFEKLMTWLTPGGILVFSVHGRFVLHRANAGNNIYGVGDRWLNVVQGYQTVGFGYGDYASEFGFGPGYGISLSKSGWWLDLIESRAGTRLSCLTERAWDNHHDVIAVQATGWD